VSEASVLTVKIDMLHNDVVEMKTALSELSKAITKLALVEERQAQTADAMERAFKAIGKIEDRISALEVAAPKTKETNAWVDRFILALVMAVAGFIGTKLGLL
jgi:menaquinone-dependent protoporphyrinogen IX oxidase